MYIDKSNKHGFYKDKMRNISMKGSASSHAHEISDHHNLRLNISASQGDIKQQFNGKILKSIGKQLSSELSLSRPKRNPNESRYKDSKLFVPISFQTMDTASNMSILLMADFQILYNKHECILQLLENSKTTSMIPGYQSEAINKYSHTPEQSTEFFKKHITILAKAATESPFNSKKIESYIQRLQFDEEDIVALKSLKQHKHINKMIKSKYGNFVVRMMVNQCEHFDPYYLVEVENYSFDNFNNLLKDPSLNFVISVFKELLKKSKRLVDFLMDHYIGFCKGMIACINVSGHKEDSNSRLYKYIRQILIQQNESVYFIAIAYALEKTENEHHLVKAVTYLEHVIAVDPLNAMIRIVTSLIQRFMWFKERRGLNNDSWRMNKLKNILIPHIEQYMNHNLGNYILQELCMAYDASIPPLVEYYCNKNLSKVFTGKYLRCLVIRIIEYGQEKARPYFHSFVESFLDDPLNMVLTFNGPSCLNFSLALILNANLQMKAYEKMSVYRSYDLNKIREADFKIFLENLMKMVKLRFNEIVVLEPSKNTKLEGDGMS